MMSSLRLLDIQVLTYDNGKRLDTEKNEVL